MLMGQKTKVKKELKESHQSLKNERRWTTVQKDEDMLHGINVLLFGPPNIPYEPIFHPMINGGDFTFEVTIDRSFGIAILLKNKNGSTKRIWHKQFGINRRVIVSSNDYIYYSKMHEIMKDFILDIGTEIEEEYIQAASGGNGKKKNQNNDGNNGDSNDAKKTETSEDNGQSGDSRSGGSSNDNNDDDKNNDKKNNDRKENENKNTNKNESKTKDSDDEDKKADDDLDEKDEFYHFLFGNTASKTEQNETISTRTTDPEEIAKQISETVQDKEKFITTPLTHVMSIKGIDQCSGHCDSMIMKFAHTLYAAILHGKVNGQTFSSKQDSRYSWIFWKDLINGIVNNQEIGLMYQRDDYKYDSNQKSQSLKEIIQLIKRMIDSDLSIARTFDVLDISNVLEIAGSDKKNQQMTQNGHDWMKQFEDIITDVKENDRSLNEKLEKTICTMFYELTAMYEKKYHSNNINIHDNQQLKKMDWIFNKLLVCVLYHNYFKNYQQNWFGYTLNIESSIVAKKIGRKSDLPLSFSKYFYKLCDSAAFEQLMSITSSGNKDDFDLKKFIILTIQFLVECESTGVNIHCYYENIPFEYRDCEKATDKARQRCYQELVRNKFISYVPRSRLGQLEKMTRNTAMRENKLTLFEMTSIYLMTLPDVSLQVKPAHRRGETCKYRYMCHFMLTAITKLKLFDMQSSLRVGKPENVYLGLSNVTFREQLGEAIDTTGILQFINKYWSAANPRTTNWEDCTVLDTITSTTINPMIAMIFSNKYVDSDKGGIVLQFESKQLIRHDRILCADISWLSSYRREGEIMVAPIMIWAHEPADKYIPKEFLDAQKRYSKIEFLDENLQSKHSKVLAAEAIPLKRISLIQQMQLARKRSLSNNVEMKTEKQTVDAEEMCKVIRKKALPKMDETNSVVIFRKVVNKVYRKFMKDGDVSDIKSEYNLVKGIYKVCVENVNDEKNLKTAVSKALIYWDIEEFADLK